MAARVAIFYFEEMATTRVNINKDLVEWAIIRAGYDIQDFVFSNPMVSSWLNEDKKPTLKQLEAFSRKVHVPFGYLFLENPPEEELPIPFFRTGRGATTQVSLNVYDAIHLVQRRQDWVIDYLQDEGFEPLDFVGRFEPDTPYSVIANDIRRTLELPPNWASYHNSIAEALNYLTIKIEEAGVFMNFSGVVGNNTKRPIEVAECRGFVLVDEYAPFMFVNAADAKAGQMFTIIHELAHIWLGKSAGFDMETLLPADDPIERLCDQVAAEFLVPQDGLLAEWPQEQNFQKLNRIFKVSPIVVARRALDLRLIDRQAFFDFYNQYIAKFKNKSKGAGGNFYATAKKRVSLRFASFVNQAVQERKVLYRDAYQLTGLKGNTYANFMKEHLYQA